MHGMAATCTASRGAIAPHREYEVGEAALSLDGNAAPPTSRGGSCLRSDQATAQKVRKTLDTTTPTHRPRLISLSGTLRDQSNRASNGSYRTSASGKESYMLGGKIDFLGGIEATLGHSRALGGSAFA